MVVDVVLPAVLGLVHVGEPGVDTCNKIESESLLHGDLNRSRKAVSSSSSPIGGLGCVSEVMSYQLVEC